MPKEANEEGMARTVTRMLDELAAIKDPKDRALRAAELLDDWPVWHGMLREIRQGAVTQMKEKGLSYRQIGDELGMHFTRARQIAQGQRGEKNRPKKRAADPPPTEE